MPLDAAQLTLAKLNSALGGRGGEWGSEAGPSGAALPIQIRGKARELGNQGQTAAAVDLLLGHAQKAKVHLPGPLLDEIERTVLPQADNQQLRASLGGALAVLRHVPAPGAANSSGAGGFLAKLFGKR